MTFLQRDSTEKRRKMAEDIMLGNLITLPGHSSGYFLQVPDQPWHEPPKNPLTPTTSIATFLQRQDRTVKAVVGDGNCLFRSLAIQLFNNEGIHKQLRPVIATCQIEHPIWYSAIWGGEGDFIQNHVEKMKKDRVWGTQVELQATADLFSLPIYVCSPHPQTKIIRWMKFSPSNRQFQISTEAQALINLAFTNNHIEVAHTGSHYDGVKSVSGKLLDIPQFPQH